MKKGLNDSDVSRWKIVAIASLLAVILLWILWPSSLSRVRNLDSKGEAIIAFGDSLTAGYGAGPGEDYPSRLSAMLAQPVFNAGVSGDTTESALARLDRDVLARNPRIVIVGLGGNDFLQRAEIASAEANLRSLIGQIQGRGAMVVLLGYQFPGFGPRYDTMYERFAKDEGCLLVSDLLDGIIGDPELKSDQIHPNGRGYQLMAERISGPVKKLIRKANKTLS